MSIIRTIFLFPLVWVMALHGQTTALPFLVIGTSISGNGMGEVRGSLNNGSTLMSAYNPGLLGVRSFDSRFSAESFDRHSAWLPSFHLSDLWIHSTAFSFGTILGDNPILSMPIAVGLGYSNTYLNLGELIVASELGPPLDQHYAGYERVDALSAGTAIRFWHGITAGAGINIKRVVSSLGWGQTTPWMTDLGAFVDLPVIPDAIHQIEIVPGMALRPESFLSFSYVYRNIGGNVHYGSSIESDPLPREITAGLALRAGVSAAIGKAVIPLISGTLVREANDLAVARSSDGTSWTYRYGFGNISFANNLIDGKLSPDVTLRRGYEYTVMGVFSFSAGSNKMPNREFFKTSGRAVHLHAIFPVITSLSEQLDSDPVIGYLLNHLQISYLTSSYASDGILNTTSFSGFVIGLR